MKSNQDARDLAIKLRHAGSTLDEIAEKTKTARGTVYYWIKNLPVSVGLKNRLEIADVARLTRWQKIAEANKKTWAERREASREEGRRMAREGKILHAQGCMLYWAEGAKSRCNLQFTNSDPAMLLLFMRFLEECLGVPIGRVKVKIHCYDDVHSVSTILSYWENLLGTPKEQFRAPVVNSYPLTDLTVRKKRYGKLPYGTCHLLVCDVRLTQHIYGALEIYASVFLDPGRRSEMAK